MPLITACVLAYAAGLLSGFAGASGLLLAAAAPVIWYGSAKPRDRIALTAVAVAGLANGTAITRSRERCLERLIRAASIEFTLAASASPGTFATGHHECGIRVGVAVERGRAAEGARIIARGEIAEGRNGIVITRATLRAVDAPGVLPRWRAMLGRRIDAHFAENAPLVRALLIADIRELSPTVRERFAAAGLSHMLSVSGLHVGLIAVAVSLLAQVAGIAKRRADIGVVSLTAIYVLVIGAPLPAVRAAVMLGAVSVSSATQRPTSAWAILAVSALLPLADPASMADLGFQLSMVGMVALVASGSLAKRIAFLHAPGWRGTLARSLATSLLATLLTAPLVAATFGRVSLVAPLTNLVAVPVMAALQPMLFLATVLFPVPAAAGFVADATHPLILAVELIAEYGARLPGASIVIIADAAAMLLASGAVVALVLACVVRHAIRPVLAALVCIAILAWRPVLPSAAGNTELHMIDVGQGDAIALRSARGRWVVVDAGRDWKGGDAGRRDVVPYIARRGGVVDAFVLSHPHSDHAGGATSVIAALRPRLYLDPGYPGGTPSYRASLLAAQNAGTRWQRIRPGDSLVVDEMTFTFLAPDSAWADRLRDPNDASSVLVVRVGDVRMLLTGDAELGEEEWLLRNQHALLDVDVLKVAHHGSNTSSSADFLAAVTPRLALVSVGTGNVYRHPSSEVMRGLAASGAVVMRTDREGSIVVRTDGQRLEVESRGERWTLRRKP